VQKGRANPEFADYDVPVGRLVGWDLIGIWIGWTSPALLCSVPSRRRSMSPLRVPVHWSTQCTCSMATHVSIPSSPKRKRNLSRWEPSEASLLSLYQSRCGQPTLASLVFIEPFFFAIFWQIIFQLPQILHRFT
jgi:hypothetical protein